MTTIAIPKLRATTELVAGMRPNLNRKRMAEKANIIRDGNYWDPLLTLVEDANLEMDEACKMFMGSS